jgi:hypothetical protein
MNAWRGLFVRNYRNQEEINHDAGYILEKRADLARVIAVND